jgi:hypothetical protein
MLLNQGKSNEADYPKLDSRGLWKIAGYTESLDLYHHPMSKHTKSDLFQTEAHMG